MDTNRLKRFATEARNILMQGVTQRFIALGFEPDGTINEEPQQFGGGAVFMGDTVSIDFYNKWMSLKKAIEHKGINEVAEEAAYTWFNRMVAIRIMVKNELITPVLEYESEDIRVPVIVSESRQGRPPRMDDATRQKWETICDDDSKTSEQFQLLIVAYCHANPIINKCFGGLADYTELLLPSNILSEGGFIDMLNAASNSSPMGGGREGASFITDEDFHSPELIGWLYQFYISEKKDDVFASFKKGKKAEAKDIPAATQIFTPNWIVKYMVQNTVGRIWLDNNPYSDIKEGMKYLVEPEDQEMVNGKSINGKLIIDDVHDLTCADLACGSGHILNECFDLLYQIYVEEGYSRHQAVEDIFKYNLTGIDLDTRAKQLAQFALLLKACQKDNSFADGHCMPRVYDMPEPYAGKENLLGELPHFLLGNIPDAINEIIDAITLMDDAKNLGSIMKFDISERTRNIIEVRVKEYEEQEFVPEKIEELLVYMRIILALTKKYSALVMNPPYMGAGNMNGRLSQYVKDNYEEGKTDLCTVFMIMESLHLKPNGNYANIIPPSWMFLSGFEKLRRSLLENKHIDSLLHLGRGIFGSDFGSCAFVIKNGYSKSNGTYRKLFKEFVQVRSVEQIHQLFLDKEYGLYYADQNNFKNIVSCPIGYWLSEKSLSILTSGETISKYAAPRQGFATGDNNKFLRYVWEVAYNKRGKAKWIPCTKGGAFRKWYGNIEYCVNWENEGNEMKNFSGSVMRNQSYYFNSIGVTWSTLTAGSPSFRYFNSNWLFESKGSVCFPNNVQDNNILLGYLNSPLVKYYLTLFSPTVDYHEGPVGRLPYLPIQNTDIDNKVSINTEITKLDWNSHETSWDFQLNPLCEIAKSAGYSDYKLSALVNLFETEQEENFRQLHYNEEELNRQFIQIYGLQDELTPDVAPEEITILQQGEISFEDGTGLKDEDPFLVIHDRKLVWHHEVIVKQLISYAVGCMMGRYSIDKPGLILANQGDTVEDYNRIISDYLQSQSQIDTSSSSPWGRSGGVDPSFDIDDDGIVPIMSGDCEFTDNAPLRFKTWLSTTFGSQNLVENLNFIEKSLGKTIDDYFTKDFWKDHKKMYQNRPIYWLFTSSPSGRSGGAAFQCLVYMHRMNPYTAEKIRSNYLLPHIEWLINKQNDMQANAASLSTRERKELDSIGKQILECREYHDRLHSIADLQIAFDLDDGVVVNYAKFGDVVGKIK